jgi:hypothetical protein
MKRTIETEFARWCEKMGIENYDERLLNAFRAGHAFGMRKVRCLISDEEIEKCERYPEGLFHTQNIDEEPCLITELRELRAKAHNA